MLSARESALNNIILSIAAEETALARMITAESKKIEYVLCCVKQGGCTEKGMRLLLDVNKSAENLMHRIADIQMLLKNKLGLITEWCPCPTPPQPPPPPPKYTCDDFNKMPFPMDVFAPPQKKEFMENEKQKLHKQQKREICCEKCGHKNSQHILQD